jgi:hypothetical protein
VRTPEVKRLLGNLDAEERLILKRILEKWNVGVKWVHLVWVRDQ